MTTAILSAESDDTVEILISTVSLTATKKAYWGWSTSGDTLSETQILVLQQSGDFVPGGAITADFRAGNDTPKYLFFAEKATEPAKTVWYGSGLDNGPIGPAGVFQAVGIIGAFRLYRSFSPTQFFTTTEFRIS